MYRTLNYMGQPPCPETGKSHLFGEGAKAMEERLPLLCLFLRPAEILALFLELCVGFSGVRLSLAAIFSLTEGWKEKGKRLLSGSHTASRADTAMHTVMASLCCVQPGEAETCS